MSKLNAGEAFETRPLGGDHATACTCFFIDGSLGGPTKKFIFVLASALALALAAGVASSYVAISLTAPTAVAGPTVYPPLR
jgi:hypothetical protein